MYLNDHIPCCWSRLALKHPSRMFAGFSDLLIPRPYQENLQFNISKARIQHCPSLYSRVFHQYDKIRYWKSLKIEIFLLSLPNTVGEKNFCANRLLSPHELKMLDRWEDLRVGVHTCDREGIYNPSWWLMCG